MPNVNQLKNKARREEQRENWSRAIEYYTKALDASRAEDEAFADLSLYNRIGDIYLRIGQKNTAVRYYEQAIERYAEQDLHTSAIALCNKVLRILPDRSTIFLQLGRLHLATNLIADSRAHFHRYAESMRERGGATAGYEALEELIGLTGDRPTLSLWISWLIEEGDAGLVDQRVEAARDALEGQGIDPQEVLRRVETGDASDFEVGPTTVAREDPLAGAFLSVPDHYAGPLKADGANRTRPDTSEASPLSKEGPSPRPGDVESPPGDEKQAARDAVLEGMHTFPADVDLGSIQWSGEAEEPAAAAPSSSEVEVPEAAEAEQLEGPVAGDRAASPTFPAPTEDIEIRAEGGWGLDFREPAGLEDFERPGPEGAEESEAPALEPLESDGDFVSTVPPAIEAEGCEPAATSLHQAALDVRAVLLERIEVPDGVDSRCVGESKGHPTEGYEAESACPGLASDIKPLVALELEASAVAAPPRRLDLGVAPEPSFASSAPPLGCQPSPRDPSEDRAVATASPSWGPVVDSPETLIEPEAELSPLPGTPDPDASEPASEEADNWVADTYDEIGRVMSAAAEAASAQAAAAKTAAEAEQAAVEAAAAEQAAAVEQAAAEAAAAEEAAVEAAAAEQAAAVEQAAAEAAAAEEAAVEAAAAEQAAAETAATESAAAESDAASLRALEAETITLEVPHEVAREDERVALAADPVEPAMPSVGGGARDANPGPSAPESTAAPSQPDIEESRPLAEPRSSTAKEDPEDAFSDWIGSASNAVLRRALPELEERNEREKALLVITRLSQLERDGVEYRRKHVDALEQLGHIDRAIEACLALASALESMERPIEARDAYGRVLALAPEDARAQQGLQRLEEFLEEPDGAVDKSDGHKPYTPSHVKREPTMIATHERPSNGMTRHRGPSREAANGSVPSGTAYDSARPYSGVAGGVEASSDFEALLSEFRAELSEKPSKSDPVSRTEYGADLKEMGRLDDAIRELQAAVREPSPPALAYELLGEAFLEKGQSRIAMRLLEKALTTLGQTDRELLGVLYQLGLTYEQLDDPSNALLCYERIFSIDIDYRDVQSRILTCSP